MLAEQIELEIFQPASCPVLYFPGLEIRPLQRRVLRDGTEINLTRLEYGTLAFLVSSPGIVFTRTQIFEAVWNMESDSCHSGVFYFMRSSFRSISLTVLLFSAKP